MDQQAARQTLEKLDRGFRKAFLTFDELTAQVRAWADAFPDIVRLSSIGDSAEGRELWLLTLGPEPDRVRPAVWVDGNMHAVELCGSSVALAIAEEVIRLHLGIPTLDLAAPIVERLRDVLVYVLPRMSPDGAEAVLKTGRYLRSSPRDGRPNRGHAHWRCSDVDGDGLALRMRVRDPAGDAVESADIPGLLLPRRIDDPGPYYKVYPEGTIENFDGRTIPAPYYLSDNELDLNRNFPWSWAPEPEQEGAGAYPMSAPESRAVVEFSSARPHIFAWLNLHTFGGVLIRPLGDKPDSKMNPGDLAVFQQLEAWMTEHAGYPTVSGFSDFTYEPEKPLHGDLTDYAYHQRGSIAYVVELWDFFNQVGIERSYKRFVDRYLHLTREDLVRIATWDKEHNHGRMLRPWKTVKHPQLGEVEVGGVDPRVGMWNPPYERIAEICAAQTAVLLRLAALSPAVAVTNVEREPLADGLTRVTVTVQNLGYLPTHILASAMSRPLNEPLYATVETDGCELDPSSPAHTSIGHLGGWGHGYYRTTSGWSHTDGRGSEGKRVLTYVVRGRGALHLRVGSCRVGWITQRVEV